MKKVITLSAAVGFAFSALASAPSIPAGSAAVKTYGNAVASRAAGYEVFYPAPAGVFYLGLPMDNNHSMCLSMVLRPVIPTLPSAQI